MPMPSLPELCGSATLRGRYGVDLDGRAAERLGRGLGTLIKRRGLPPGPVVVARAGPGARTELRDGLVRGLVLAGHDVKDIGASTSEVFTFALRHLKARGGALVQSDDGSLQIFIFFLEQSPLVGPALHGLAGLAAGEDFAAGAGTLELVDVAVAFRDGKRAEAERARREGEGSSSMPVAPGPSSSSAPASSSSSSSLDGAGGAGGPEEISEDDVVPVGGPNTALSEETIADEVP